MKLKKKDNKKIESIQVICQTLDLDYKIKINL